MHDNLWPVVGSMLQARYVAAQRARLEEAAKDDPHITPWPRRRTSKRKPLPGVIDAQELEG